MWRFYASAKTNQWHLLKMVQWSVVHRSNKPVTLCCQISARFSHTTNNTPSCRILNSTSPFDRFEAKPDLIRKALSEMNEKDRSGDDLDY